MISFSATPFSVISETSLLFNWVTPVIDQTANVPINYYKIYWDEGFRNSG